ncbi:MAG TPA: DUF2012 domain-containing protein, partial [Chitinophagales bacterium]|nr:DUF2012 domain-containing protein [Chitinophagales bacterium]
MKKVLTLLMCLITVSVWAQNSTVKGLIKDELSQQPLSGAFVNLTGSKFSTTTGTDGKFTFTDVPYGAYTLAVSDSGHAAFAVQIVVNSPETTVGSIGLSEPEKETETVVEKEEIQEKMDAGDIVPVSLSDDDLDDVSGQGISGALGSSRDVFLNTSLYVMSNARFKIRGYKSEDFTVLMNGIPMNDPETGYVPFGNWGGLNRVMRNRSNTLGLAANDISFGGVGGVFALDSRASSQRPGLEVS